MSIVVTGSAGFIASHLVEYLDARGQWVVGIDRRPWLLEATGSHLTADLADPAHADHVRTLLREAECVFHLAASAGVRTTGRGIEEVRRRDNIDAARMVIEAVPPSTPLVVTSSSSVYGGARTGPRGLRPSSEGDPLRPLGGYARSKAAMEQLCAARAARGGMVAVARPFTVAGERQRPDMALSQWLERASRHQPLIILGSPNRRRDITDVRDAVRALALLAEKGVQGVVNIGSGRARTLAELTEAVGRALDVEVRVTVKPARAEEPPATLADTHRLQRLLGFVPHRDVDSIISRQAMTLPLVEEAV